SAAACLGGDLRRPEDATVGGDGRILDVPPGVRRPSRESQGQILLLFIVARDAAVGGHFGLVVAGVAVKRKVAVLIGAPLPQLIRQNQIAAILELGFLHQSGVVAIGGVVAAAVVALHRVVPSAPIGHIGDIGGAGRGVEGVLPVLDVNRAVVLLPDPYRFNLGHQFVFTDGVHRRLVAVSLSALGFIVGRTHNNVIAD